MRLWEKIGKVIMNILITLLVVVALFTSYSFFVLNVMHKDYISIFGYTYFEVVSGSMSPIIEVNDIVVVKLDSDYEVGDVITYMSDGDFVTHRVSKMDQRYITTKGDANNTKDAFVNRDNVIGKVVFILPKAGICKDVFMTPKVLVLLIVTLTLFSFSFSYNTKKKRKKLRRQIQKRENSNIEDTPIKK